MLSISIDQFDQIKQILESAYPSEGCGILTGQDRNGTKVVEEIQGVVNERSETRNRYLIDPKVILDLEKELRGTPSTILGFFHSHPDVDPVPSDYDRDYAWPWLSYLILKVQEGTAEEARSWILQNDRSGFDEEQIVVEGGDWRDVEAWKGGLK